MRAPTLDFDRRPILVFWESTRACGLACRHCRAEAMPHPAEGELDHEQSLAFIESLGASATRAGADRDRRRRAHAADLLELVAHARGHRIPVALAPSVTPLLDDERLAARARSGSRSPRSRSTAPGAETHEGLRGVDAHFEATLAAVALPALARLHRAGEHRRDGRERRGAARDRPHRPRRGRLDLGGVLPRPGRARRGDRRARPRRSPRTSATSSTTPRGTASSCAPSRRRSSGASSPGARRAPLRQRAALRAPPGEPRASCSASRPGARRPRPRARATARGSCSSPSTATSIRQASSRSCSATSRSATSPRSTASTRSCATSAPRASPAAAAVCEYRDLCGGSRARAFAASGDPLGEDPACAYVPA